jgi:S1-C subfamily serine protease
MTKLFYSVVFFVMSSAAIASGWTLEQMNRVIDQTNFVVNRGCSGTLISIEERLILTNHHCIDRNISFVEREEIDNNGFAKKVRVRRYADVNVEQHGYDGFARVSTSSYVAEIVAEEKKYDLAVLRIKSNIPHQLASKILPDDLKIVRGERVYVVGNPAGNDATVVEGIVSNLNRTFQLPWTGNEKVAMIQFSGGIYGGNSGGALYNSAGYLIGVPAAGHRDATFIGLAIPISTVKSFLADHCLARVYNLNFNISECMARRKKEQRGKTN